MIKTDFIKSKLYESYEAFRDLNPSNLKYLSRSGTKKLRKKFLNESTKQIFYSKFVTSEVSGVSILNINFNSCSSIFGSFRKTIKSQKSKRNKGLDFICWSNYFSFLLMKMRYLVLIAVQNPDFLQRAFRKYRFSGFSYLYLSYGVVRGLYSFTNYFGEFNLDKGTILFYSSSYSKFMELIDFLYSDNFYQDFIVLKIKVNDVLMSDVRFLFFFQSLGFNNLSMFNILKTCFFTSYVRGFSKILLLLYESFSVAVIGNFLPLRLFLLKYVNIYSSWKGLSQAR